MYIDSNTLALLHLDGDLKDSSGKNVNFTRDYGNATFDSASKFGRSSLKFDGKSSIACPYGAGGITLGNQFTIDFWAKTNRYTGQLCMFTIGTTHNDNAICLYAEFSNNKLIFYLGTYSSHLSNFTALADNNWHHYAIVYNNGYYDAYFDGKKVINKFYYPFAPRSNYKIRFGGSIGALNEFWLDGYMDEIRISNCVRYTSDFTPEGGHTPLWQ